MILKIKNRSANIGREKNAIVHFLCILKSLKRHLMKTFYSIFLLICFVLSTDAQSDNGKSSRDDSASVTIADSLKLSITDSSASSAKDSIKKISESLPAIKYKTVLGIASYYNRSFEGIKTATGEFFHQKNLTGASNCFKLNSWVRVTNLKTGSCVIIRINDRMHPSMAKKGRVVDLTSAAAKNIGLSTKAGILKVRIEQVPEGTTE